MFCWELGGGLGHITKAILLAEQLLDEGCEIVFAFKDLADVHTLLPSDEYRLVQSPIWQRKLSGAQEPASYPELLLHFGFGSSSGLKGLCRAWRDLFQAFNIDMIVADHAPNAILAARTQEIPVVLYGNGFFSPPPVTPIPPFRTTRGDDQRRLAECELIALRSANECLLSFDAKPLQKLSDLSNSHKNLLCTVAELDHYAPRDNATYCGPVYVDQVGGKITWHENQARKKRIFAYLYAHMEGLDALLDALSETDAEIALFCSGIAPELRKRHESGRFQFISGLVNLEAVASECDLFACGGTDTAYCAIFNGLPVLGVPVVQEQQISAERIKAAGAGLWAPPGSDARHWKKLLHQLLTETSFKQNASTFARKYQSLTPEIALNQIASEILDQLSSSKP